MKILKLINKIMFYKYNLNKSKVFNFAHLVYTM